MGGDSWVQQQLLALEAQQSSDVLKKNPAFCLVILDTFMLKLSMPYSNFSCHVSFKLLLESCELNTLGISCAVASRSVVCKLFFGQLPFHLKTYFRFEISVSLL